MTKTAPKKTGLTVKVDGKVGDGGTGYLKKGDRFEPGPGCDVDGLKERGLIG